MIDDLISSGRLSDFIDELLTINAEEKAVEFWLHKVFDKELSEFLAELGLMKAEKADPIDVGKAFNESRDILGSFVPE